jgi:outer membrane protein TolC
MARTIPQCKKGGSPRRACFCALALLVCFAASPCSAQLTFRDAIRMALANSPRIKAALNGVAKAKAGVGVARDMYIPSVVADGGVGDAYGIMLSVPTIFTVQAQSLVWSLQQRSYTRAARADLDAARLSLEEVRQQVEEDAAITYLSIDRAQDVSAALNDQVGYAQRLLAIMQDRVASHLDSELDLKTTERDVLQIRLQQLQARDDLEDLRGHMAELTGLAPEQVRIDSSSIPVIPEDAAGFGSTQKFPDTPGIRAAAESARARAQQAQGDARYAWRPSISFAANYGRVSPIENVEKFYNLNGIYNVASFGFTLQVPLLDRVRSEAAQESKLDAVRAQMDLDTLRTDELADRHKLARSIPELAMKAEMADLDDQIAQEQLKAVYLQAQHASGETVITPKEEMKARIQERQKYVDMLNARLDAHKAEISYLRLTGQLDGWINGVASVKP